MAKTDNIGDFCADLAEGLRLKTGKTEPINAQDFRSVLDDIRTFKPEEELVVTPSTLKQEIAPSEGSVFNKVTVSPVTNDIDKNITPNNIRTGTVILGVVGNLEPDKPDQTKTITPTTTQQTIYPDSGYELAGVVVNAVNPSDYYKTEESVVIEPSTKVQIKTPNDGVVYNHVIVNAVTNTIDPNIKSENIISGVSILGVNGNLQIQQVKINSENIETTGKTFAINNQDYIADFTTSGKYVVPETIEVKINNSILTPNVDYEYTPNNNQGRLVIPVNKITGDIEISIVGFLPVATINYTTIYAWSIIPEGEDVGTTLSGTGTITANVGDIIYPTWMGSGGYATVNGEEIGFGLDGDYESLKIIAGGEITINDLDLTGPIEGVLVEY